MKAYLLSLNPEASVADQWDYGFLRDFLEGRMWKPNNWADFDIQRVTELENTPKAVVAIPARHHAGLEDQINTELQKIDNVVLFLLGDEEADFDVEKIDHPSIHIWVQNPHPDKHDKYHKLGTGYPPHMKPEFIEKTVDVFFSGQITHRRRLELWDILTYIDTDSDINIRSIRTKGFTQGLTHDDYFKEMNQAKIVPCPSGAVVPDSFRFFEALECMCIPVADEVNPSGTITQYWDWLLGANELYKITSWERLYGLIPEILEDYPNNLHKQTAWWINYKREFAYKVMEQLHV